MGFLSGLSRLQSWIGLGMAAVIAVLAIWLTIERANHATTRAGLTAERLAHEATVAGYRAAAELAAARDRANALRVQAEQRAANERIENDYQDRIDALRRDYDRRLRDARARADTGGAGGTHLPDIPGAPGGADGAAADHGFPEPGATAAEFDLFWRRIASEQAIQLDALIDWVDAQRAVDFGNGQEPGREPGP